MTIAVSITRTPSYVPRNPNHPLIKSTILLALFHKQINEKLCFADAKKYEELKHGYNFDHLSSYQKLGQGTFSVVYAVSEEKVVKVINPILHQIDPYCIKTYRHFLMEARYLQTLNPHNLSFLPKFIFGVASPPCLCKGKKHYGFEIIIAMTRAPGDTVVAHARNGQPMLTTIESIRGIAKQLLSAEQALNNILRQVHADLSHNNVVFCKEKNHVTIIDLGSMASIDMDVCYLKETCTTIFCPPEVNKKKSGPIQPGVLFSYGAIVFEMITGQTLIDCEMLEGKKKSSLDQYYLHRLSNEGLADPKQIKKRKPQEPESWTEVIRTHLRLMPDYDLSKHGEAVTFLHRLCSYEPHLRYDNAASALQDSFLTDGAS